MWKGLIETYQKYLPVKPDFLDISLQEGNTPLIFAPSLSEMVGAEVYLKYEGLNPTASFKDRGMVVAATQALHEGSEAVMCASTGNTSASAAAYAARSGLRCVVLVPHGNIAYGKLSQALIHGAELVAIDGNFDLALNIVKEITDEYPVTLVNSLNPYRLEGQKTAAFEICDQLETAPEYLAIPVGNAGNITAYWKGFTEYYAAGEIDQTPKMMGFQAAGAAPLVNGAPVEEPETLATAIRIGNPASWSGAVQAASDSGGSISSVTDKEIMDAYALMAKKEGVFAEPASAASVAGVLKLSQAKIFRSTDKIVCVNTGHGLKDPDRAIEAVQYQERIVSADKEKVIQAIWGDKHA